MTLVAAVVIAGALLAVWAGIAKLVTPHAAVRAMRAARLASSPSAVRAVAACEVVVGVLVLATTSWVPRVLLAVVFAALLAFAARSVRAGSEAPCGCFGVGARPVGPRHVVVDASIAACAAGSLLPLGYPTGSVGSGGALVGALVIVVGCCTAALVAAFLARDPTRSV